MVVDITLATRKTSRLWKSVEGGDFDPMSLFWSTYKEFKTTLTVADPARGTCPLAVGFRNSLIKLLIAKKVRTSTVSLSITYDFNPETESAY